MMILLLEREKVMTLELQHCWNWSRRGLLVLPLESDQVMML